MTVSDLISKRSDNDIGRVSFLCNRLGLREFY